MEIEKKEKKTKMIGFQTKPSIDAMLQAIADKAGCTRVAVIETLIEQEYREFIEEEKDA